MLKNSFKVSSTNLFQINWSDNDRLRRCDWSELNSSPIATPNVITDKSELIQNKLTLDPRSIHCYCNSIKEGSLY